MGAQAGCGAEMTEQKWLKWQHAPEGFSETCEMEANCRPASTVCCGKPAAFVLSLTLFPAPPFRFSVCMDCAKTIARRMGEPAIGNGPRTAEEG